MPVITWLETLPSIQSTEQLTNNGLYIFNGTTTNLNGRSIDNIIVKAVEGVMHVVRPKSATGDVFKYNAETETFDEVTFASEGVRENLKAQAPFLSWGNALTIYQIPTKETTLGKIIPTEEVSGLNFLNSYEDELTDI